MSEQEKQNHSNANEVQVLATNQSNRHIWRTFFITLGVVAIFLIIAGVTIAIYNNTYKNKIYPGVYLGNYSLGGMTREEVKDFIGQISERLSKENLIYILDLSGEEKNIALSPVISGGDNLIEIVSLTVVESEDDAMLAGRDKEGWLNFFSPIWLRFQPYKIYATVKIDENNFKELFIDQAGELEVVPNDATINITSIDPLKYDFITEKSGRVFDLDNIILQTKKQLAVLNFEPIAIQMTLVEPTVKQHQLVDMNERLKQIFSYGDIGLTYMDPNSSVLKNGKIDLKKIQSALYPYLGDDGRVWFDLERLALAKYLEDYKYIVDRPAEESKFVMKNGKLQEFKPGSSGELLNMDKTFEAISSLMKLRNIGAEGATSTVSLFMDTAEPKLKLADVNNLGITSALGSGTSTFYDSHTNRIKNIAHAVALLNGTIIAPGEIFSTTHYAGPFTLENGYLPEDVIKGNQIKKEVGGGMCQVGTTLFRMAMNAGMPITERTNHSLVVRYYADPVNGNPGTDATIYDPVLDFKFLNDTGHYLLLETQIDYKKQLLTFTLWGKPDGRSGFYSRPLVSRWIAPGEPQYIYTTSLKPGAQTCQNAFSGAVASFTYTRYTSSGEKIDRVFDSYYRPLAKICMIGVDPQYCSSPTNCSPPPANSDDNISNTPTTPESNTPVIEPGEASLPDETNSSATNTVVN